MIEVVVLLFFGSVLALVVGAMAFLSEQRARRERNDATYGLSQRRFF